MTTPEIKLVVCDLDGTLLNTQHQLSQKTIRIVRMLIENGVHFAIATGRHEFELKYFAQILGSNVYGIAANGASSLNNKGDVIRHRSLSLKEKVAILNVAARFELSVGAYTDAEWYVNGSAQDMLSYHLDSGLVSIPSQNRQTFIDLELHKLYMSGEYDSLKEIKAEISAQTMEDAPTMIFTSPSRLECMSKGVNKGSALQGLMNLLKVSAEETMAFGDSFNDIEMLNLVGHPVVMQDSVLERQDLIANANHALEHGRDGVADYIENFFLAVNAK